MLARPRLLRNEDDLGYLLRALRSTFLTQKRTESRWLRPGPLPDQLDLVRDPHVREPQAAVEASELYAAFAAPPRKETACASSATPATSPWTRSRTDRLRGPRRRRPRHGQRPDGDRPRQPERRSRSTPGVGDGQPDCVVVNATNGDDAISVNGDAGRVKVCGVAAAVGILHSEAANDRLDINTLEGIDTVDSNGLAPGAIQLFVDGTPVP